MAPRKRIRKKVSENIEGAYANRSTQSQAMEDGTVVISFRVTQDIYRDLLQVATEEQDDAGRQLNPAAAARRLMRQALEGRLRPKKQK